MSTKMNPLRAGLLAAVLAGFAIPAAAEDTKELPEWRTWPGGERLLVAVGYYRPKLNTQAAVSDSEGFLGALISFEDTLGLDKNKGTAIADIYWRISRRNMLGFNYFKLNRDASQESTLVVGIANPAPPPDFLTQEITIPVSAEFNIKSVDITYAFLPLVTPKHTLGLGIGLALQNLEFGYRASDDCTAPECDLLGEPRSVKSTAPLPTFKLTYQYAFNEKWLLAANLGYFALEFDLDDNEKLDGQIINAVCVDTLENLEEFRLQPGIQTVRCRSRLRETLPRGSGGLRLQGICVRHRGFLLSSRSPVACYRGCDARRPRP